MRHQIDQSVGIQDEEVEAVLVFPEDRFSVLTTGCYVEESTGILKAEQPNNPSCFRGISSRPSRSSEFKDRPLRHPVTNIGCRIEEQASATGHPSFDCCFSCPSKGLKSVGDFDASPMRINKHLALNKLPMPTVP